MAVLKLYLELTKPRILIMQLVTLSLGFIISRQGTLIFIPRFYYALLGTALVAAGSAVFNHIIEKDSDALMDRTKNRPIPTGTISVLNALIFGVLLSISGLFILYIHVNVLTFFIAFLTLFLYVFVYSPLKKISWFNTMVGAVPGALPPLGGWAAGVGELSLMAWSLFVILFVWQLPHFYAIAWLYKDDYSKAGLKMLSVIDSTGHRTARQMLFNSVLLWLVSLFPFFLHMAGITYLVGVSILGLWMIRSSLQFSKSFSQLAARKMIKVSVYYLLAYLGLVFVDNWAQYLFWKLFH